MDPGLEVKKGFLSVFGDPHIFADPVLGSQILADATDPDPGPKHCL